MNREKKTLGIDVVVEQAKKTIESHGDHVPMVLIEKPDGGFDIAAMQFNSTQKQEVLNHLKTHVEQTGSTKYFVIFTGWSIDSNSIMQNIHNRMRKVADDPTKLQVKEFIEYVGEQVYASPQQHPDRVEVLHVSVNDKLTGSNAIIIPFTRQEGGRINWGVVRDSDDDGSAMTNIWNVWTPHQVNLK